MTPPARVAAAIEILDQVFAGQSAEQALTRWARGARYAGSKDRAAVRDHVYQALRCRRSYAALGGGETGRAVMLGALRAAHIDPATVFTGQGHGPDSLTDAEAEGGRAALSPAEAADLPDWLWSVFESDLGDAALPAAQAQRQRAPIALRVNECMINDAQAIEILRKDGIKVRRVEACDTALIVTSGDRKIRQSAAYLSGQVELQDVSSQAAMARVPVAPGARVLDYCAGGGGKTLALAGRASAACGAQFFAHDANPARMVDLPARAVRAGVDVRCLATADLTGIAACDVVLCDVPCSGSGTWRRTPDEKWRLTPERLQNLNEIQHDILLSSCEFVAPGGQLIYTTCSLLSRENEDRIAAFLQERADFSMIDQQQWPVREDGDGFYFAALTRDVSRS